MDLTDGAGPRGPAVPQWLVQLWDPEDKDVSFAEVVVAADPAAALEAVRADFGRPGGGTNGCYLEAGHRWEARVFELVPTGGPVFRLRAVADGHVSAAGAGVLSDVPSVV